MKNAWKLFLTYKSILKMIKKKQNKLKVQKIMYYFAG